MKKGLLILTLCCTIFLQSCINELLNSFNATNTEDDYTATVSKIHLSINGGEETEYYVYNGGIANRNDSYYKMKALIDSETTLVIAFYSSMATGSYTYDSSCDIIYSDGTTRWGKSSSGTFALDISRWDSAASLSFDALLSDTTGSGTTVSVSGYVEDVPFVGFNESTVLHLTIDGAEYEYGIDGLAQDGVYSGINNLYMEDQNSSFNICFRGDFETGSYDLDAPIFIQYDEYDSGEAWNNITDDLFNVEISQWDSGGVSFSFEAQLDEIDYSTGAYDFSNPKTISGYVENVPFYEDTSDELEWVDSWWGATGTVALDGDKSHYNIYSCDFNTDTTMFYFSNYTYKSMTLCIPAADMAVGTYTLTSDDSWGTTEGLYVSGDSNYYGTITLTITQWDDEAVSFSFEGTLSDGYGNSTTVSGAFGSLSVSYLSTISYK